MGARRRLGRSRRRPGARDAGARRRTALIAPTTADDRPTRRALRPVNTLGAGPAGNDQPRRWPPPRLSRPGVTAGRNGPWDARVGGAAAPSAYGLVLRTPPTKLSDDARGPQHSPGARLPHISTGLDTTRSSTSTPSRPRFDDLNSCPATDGSRARWASDGRPPTARTPAERPPHFWGLARNAKVHARFKKRRGAAPAVSRAFWASERRQPHRSAECFSFHFADVLLQMNRFWV